jgi:GntR family transcriptional regulator
MAIASCIDAIGRSVKTGVAAKLGKGGTKVIERESWAGGIDATHLDAKLPTPLYHQIYLLLRDRIRAGTLAAGAMLPGEQELARIFNVSRITVKRSLNELASDGLVMRHRGRGTLIANRPVVPVVKGSFDTLIQSLRVMGIETEVDLLDVAEIEADKAVSDHLELPSGTLVQRAVRRRKVEGEPFSHIVSYVPIDIARRYSIADLAVTPLLVLLERVGAGAESAEQWITAVAADPVIAAVLGVAPSTALLRIDRVMRSGKNLPVQLIQGHYRPDRFQYHLATRRTRAKSGSEKWREDH